MGNCLVTTLKESVKNDAFMRLNEIEPFIFDNACKRHMTDDTFVIISVTQNAQLKFRVVNATYEIINPESLTNTQEEDYVKLSTIDNKSTSNISVKIYINKHSKIFMDLSYYTSSYSISFTSNMSEYMPLINDSAFNTNIGGSMRYVITNVMITDKVLTKINKNILNKSKIYSEILVDCSKLSGNTAYEYYGDIYAISIYTINGILPVKFGSNTFNYNYTTTYSRLNNCRLITNNNEKVIINNIISKKLIVDNIYNITLHKIPTIVEYLYIYTEDESDTINLTDIITNETTGNLNNFRIYNKNNKLVHYTYNKIQENKINITGYIQMFPKTLSDLKNLIKSTQIQLNNDQYVVFQYDDSVTPDDELLNYVNSTNNAIRLIKG